MNVRQVCGVAMVLMLYLCACGGAQRKPAEPPYEPRFSYTGEAPAGAGSIDITVGLIAPQFSGDGETYWREQREDSVAQGMVRALRTGFEALLVGKGFRTAGPFDDLDTMTFPQKKGCDFVLYPLIDITSGHNVRNIRAVDEGNVLTGSHMVMHCDVTIRPSGVILIVAKEPLTDEKMWLKKIEIVGTAQVFEGTGQMCQKAAVSQEIYNAWARARAHEAMYLDVMGALDRYVNGEEFQMLKRQAAELRARKTY